MKIQQIQLQKCLQLKSDSRDYSSSAKSQAEQSKQTYTAIIFNDPSRRSQAKEKAFNHRKQSEDAKKPLTQKGGNGEMQDLLTINSLSKLVSNQKTSNALFVNMKLNKSIDKHSNKGLQRPVSAFTKTYKITHQCLQFEPTVKQCLYRDNREVSLSRKHCFEESNSKTEEKERQRQSTHHRLESKIIQSPSNYGYIAKSRLLSGKQGKKAPQNQAFEKERLKGNYQYRSVVNFQSLHKNLLINNRTSKNSSTSKSKNLQKRHKHSSNGSMKIKQSVCQSKNKQNSNIFVLISNQRNSVSTLADKNQSGLHINESHQFTNQFHKNHSKTSLTTSILKSIKKGKCTKEKILQLTKYSLVQPKLLIENVEISKKVVGDSAERTPSNTSFSANNSINQYLNKLSSSMNKQKKMNDTNQGCALTVQCKKVTYF